MNEYAHTSSTDQVDGTGRVALWRPHGLALGVRLLFFAVVFAVAAVTITPMVFGEPNRFDEGFIASGAMMIVRGWLPIRDLFVIYGPGQYYSVAALYQLFGEDLAVSRAMHALQLSLWAVAVAATAIVTSRDRIGVAALAASGAILGAAFANPNATYPAIPAALLLVASTWGFERWFVTKAAKCLLAASMLIGLAGLYRWDFGIFGLFALGLAVLVVRLDSRSTLRDAARDLLLLAGPCLVVLAAGFGPLIYAGDWQRWLKEVPLFLVREFAVWREVYLVEPTLRRLADAWAASDPFAWARSAFHLAFVATPFILIGASLARVALRLRRGANALGRADALALVTALVALCLLNQVRVRPSLWQGFPAFAVSLPLLGYLFQRSASGASVARRGAQAVALASAALVLVLLPLYLVKDGVRDALARRWVQLDLPKAAGTQVPRWAHRRWGWDTYGEMVNYIRANTAPDEPIFSGVQDTSRLFLNDALLYFIVDRPSATRWVEMESGLSNTVAGQQEVVEALERRRVRVLVLWKMLSNEPNATSRSNGVHLLDSFVRANYAEARQFGDYAVMLRSTAFLDGPLAVRPVHFEVVPQAVGPVTGPAVARPSPER